MRLKFWLQILKSIFENVSTRASVLIYHEHYKYLNNNKIDALRHLFEWNDCYQNFDHLVAWISSGFLLKTQCIKEGMYSYEFRMISIIAYDSYHLTHMMCVTADDVPMNEFLFCEKLISELVNSTIANMTPWELIGKLILGFSTWSHFRKYESINALPDQNHTLTLKIFSFGQYTCFHKYK